MNINRISCLFCGVNNRFWTLFVNRDFSIKCCPSCGIAFTYPDPILINYKDQNFHSQFNYKSIDELPYLWRKSVNRQCDIFSSCLEKGSNILEIGCGQGLILKELKKRGFNVCGVEPGQSAVSYAQKEGLKVIQGLFPKVSLDANKYDAVLMSHVLEHIKDPVDFVNGLKKILKKNGILMFIQTNYLGIIPKVQGSDWYAWVPDQHYWHFSPKGLTAFLDKMGFKKNKLEYSNIAHPPSLLLTISNIIPSFGDQFLLLVRN